MTSPLRLACVQLNVSPEKDVNLERAEHLVRRAASRGADLVVLPEKWNAYGDTDVLRANAEDLESGPTIRALRNWASELGISIVGGSVTEVRSGHDRLSNTCPVISPSGELIAVYRKIHMFDVDLDERSYRESAAEEPGDEAVLCEVEGWPVGLLICYDLRFPELARGLVLGGAELLTLPAAFTAATGKDHWEPLIRARAIENLCYVAAAAQHGIDPAGRPTHGRSIIVDPWGVVIAQAEDADTVIVGDLDRDRLRRLRQSLPSLANRRPHAYERVISHHDRQIELAQAEDGAQ